MQRQGMVSCNSADSRVIHDGSKIARRRKALNKGRYKILNKTNEGSSNKPKSSRKAGSSITSSQHYDDAMESVSTQRRSRYLSSERGGKTKYSSNQ
eukprot:4670758-Pleurochrysis_carterae.AAC.1